MIERRNFYRILHAQPDACMAVIRENYRLLKQKLKTHPDLVCTHCGRDHRIFINGKLMGVEGVNFVFETDGDEEWCICKSCQEEQDKEELWSLCTEQLPLFGKALKIKLTNK